MNDFHREREATYILAMFPKQYRSHICRVGDICRGGRKHLRAAPVYGRGVGSIDGSLFDSTSVVPPSAMCRSELGSIRGTHVIKKMTVVFLPAIPLRFRSPSLLSTHRSARSSESHDL